MSEAGFSTFEQQDGVLVALSGGVDSSVCVQILHQQGFAVQAAVIRFSPAHEGAVEAAQKAAGQLGVPLHVIDAQEEFDRLVVSPFCESYCRGETPNPCIRCNPALKFRLLAEEADRLGIDLIATGHYARVVQDEDGLYRIHRPESEARDQSYMLYRLEQDILKRLVLPLGEFEKDDIREMARESGLACADAPDSMEICFIPDGDYTGFIRARGLTDRSGRFIGPEGQDLGPHKGVASYTVGQRRGLGIALGEPVFVQRILENGDVQLGRAGQEFARRVRLRDWAGPSEMPPAGSYLARVRSAAKPAACRFDGAEWLEFDEPVRAPAPGQSAVLYAGGAVLGGGIIDDFA